MKALSLNALKPDWFLIGMGVAIVLAALFPEPGAKGGWMQPEILVKAGIALIFFLYGGTLSLAALAAGVRRWQLHVIIQATTFIVFPVLGVVIIALSGDWLSEPLKLGLFYLCALPSTVSSSVAMTSAARGNVPVAVFNATLSNLIGVVATPLWMSLMLRTAGVQLDVTGVLLDLCLWLVLPMVVGQSLRPLIGGFLQRNRKMTQLADRGTILLLVYTTFCDSFANHIWTDNPPSVLLLVAFWSLVLFVVVTAALWLLSDRTGITPHDRAAVVFCGTKKSMATGVPMAHLIFAGDENLGLILLPIMIYHSLQLMLCAVLAARWAKDAEQHETA